MSRHHIVIIGSGFAGLTAARRLKHADADITLLARTSHHLFQPLLYQVATGILSEGDIAPTTREILRKQKNVRVLQALVEDIDVENRIVRWRNHNEYNETSYDTLLVAAGAGQSYFGNDHFAVFAPGMKTIDDALELRARIFSAFEQAEIATDPAEIQRLLTFVVVGAGPTGVEMAGQIRELASKTLKGEFRQIDPTQARVILVDGAPYPLPPFGEKLGQKTRSELEKLGVEMKMDAFVTNVDADGVTLKYKSGEEETIESVCKVWAAGVSASPLGAQLAKATGAQVDRSGRVEVNKDLTLPNHPEIFVLGDMMAFPGVPGVAQGAIQSARFAADTVRARLAGRAPKRTEFSYFDKGSMATIARFKAVKKFSTDQRRVRKLASKKHEVFRVGVARIGRRAFNCEACQPQWLSDRFFDPATNLCSRGFFKHVCGRFNSRIGVDPAGARRARNGALPHCHSRGVGQQVLKRHPRIGSGRTQSNEASGDRNQC